MASPGVPGTAVPGKPAGLAPVPEAVPREAGGGTVPPEWEERIREALSTVTDPCCKDVGLSVVDMGLIERITLTGDGVEVRVVLTTGWCPFTAYLFEEMKEAVARALPEAGRVEVRVDWGKAWTSDRLSPRAAAELLFLPSPKDARDVRPAPPGSSHAGGTGSPGGMDAVGGTDSASEGSRDADPGR